MSKLFGTDGIRGKAYEKVTQGLAYDVGRAMGIFNNGVCLVGADTRESSDDFKRSIIDGLKEANIFVHDFNVVSTPCLLYLTKIFDCMAVMITASHNPYYDNGIKVFMSGAKLLDQDIKKLESTMGKTVKVEKPRDKQVTIYEYYERMKSFKINKNLKVSFDLSNGALTYIAPEILSNYEFTKDIINNEPNGKNINDNCGSENIRTLKGHVIANDFDYGIAFDGDGDRIRIVDKENEYDGAALIYAIAKYLKDNNKLAKNTLVFTEDVNPGVLKSLNSKEIFYKLVEVGDKNVASALEKDDLILGGETSGHIILKKYSPTGDGLLNALFILEMLSQTGATLKELVSDLELFPIIRENLEHFDESIVDDKRFKEQIETLKSAIPGYSLVLVRKSGTEHLLRITVSFETQQKCNEFFNVILSAIGGL